VIISDHTDGLVRRLRAVASTVAFLPPAIGGLGLGLLTRDRRRGVNFFTSNWPRLMFLAAGIQLRVAGEENLTAQRPAVFIFNHRNNFDPIIAAALLRNDWTGVAKKELADAPIAGALGRLMDTVYVDRDHKLSAIESMKGAEDLVKEGLSILAAPEGTRVDTSEVGPFKKGPFRIAMAAGIPIVPIVIRNADVVAARNSSVASSGTVEVAVFPPLSVEDWTVQNLPERIADVRQLYVDALAAWPVDTSPDSKSHLRSVGGRR
jgi:putative phosphoserine phosphatase / 1-acylglycerol-3-phosphate O-acyltransferase